MLSALIIDDEPKGRLSLKQKLNIYCGDVSLIGEAKNGEEGLQLIEKLRPDIVFLDIEMPKMGGFEMLLKVQEHNFHLIFTTAYDHYAIKAIRFAAFDYLLKPINIEELQGVIERIKNHPNLPNTPTRIKELSFNLVNRFNKIAISSTNGISFYKIEDIIYIEAKSNYTVFSFLGSPKLMVSKTLKDFEELLPPDLFFRPHHSFIINLQYIKRYRKGDGGQIEMQDGKIVSVSRRKKEEFVKIMGI